MESVRGQGLAERITLYVSYIELLNATLTRVCTEEVPIVCLVRDKNKPPVFNRPYLPVAADRVIATLLRALRRAEAPALGQVLLVIVLRIRPLVHLRNLSHNPSGFRV